jgi:methyl-accepting chemotaxis protein
VSRTPWRRAPATDVRQLSTPAGLREIVDAAPTTLMLLDERGVIVHRSAGAARSLQQLVADHGQPVVGRLRDELTRRAISGTTFPYEFDVTVPGDGETVTARCTVVRLAHGYLTSYTDLTAQLKATAATETSVTGLTGTSRELAELGAQLADGTQQAGQHASLVASGAQELTSSIQEIASSAGQAAQGAQAVVDSTVQAAASIQRLRASGEQIGGIVRLISMIAEQTKLLALNATIEAARAGAYGRGFGVVADEVKTLAARTAEATESVTGMIGSIQQETEETTSAVQQIEQLVDSVAQLQTSIAGAVEQQSATANQMSVSITDMAGNVRRSADVAASVRHLAGAVADSAELLGHSVLDVVH